MKGKKLGIAKAGLSAIVGNAGEYLVAGELLRRGILAALTPKNAPGFDILATDRSRTVYIRVKTKLSGEEWRWNAKSGDWRAEIFSGKVKNDYCVLVDLSQREGPPRFFIVKTKKLERRLQSRHKKWVETPGKLGQKHSKDNRIRMLNESSSFLKRVSPNNWEDLKLQFQI
jgi:hypothetical protein